MHENLFNNYAETCIQRCGEGIRLLEQPGDMNSSISMQKLFDMPFNVYFMGADSRVRAANEAVPKTFNIVSLKETIGISVNEVARKDCAIFSLKHDHDVMHANQMIMRDESYIRLDDISFDMLTIKFPWYHENHVTGILGLSLMVDKKWGMPLSESVKLLAETGLLNKEKKSSRLFPGMAMDDVYFTSREKEIMFHLIHGKSARNIADILDRSQRTIEQHIENMKKKMNCHSKSALIEKIMHQLFPDQ